MWKRAGKKECFRQMLDQCLIVKRAKKEGLGEDSFLCAVEKNSGIIGVFDGSGGSGAKRYPAFQDRTGAYIASRILSETTCRWYFEEGEKERFLKKGRGEQLKQRLDRELQQYRAMGQAESVLCGSMSKEFPSTLAAVVVESGGRKENEVEAEVFWSGDSRIYLIDQGGLHQLTTDDLPNPDAMVNLREDAGMLNVVSASHPYNIHEKIVGMKLPAILLAATDGCFGYLPTPMEFEKLLLRTLEFSESIAEWEANIDHAIGEISGDDYTLCAFCIGFGSFQKMKESFRKRRKRMEEQYHFSEKMTEEELFLQWNSYKKGYEQDGWERER